MAALDLGADAVWRMATVIGATITFGAEAPLGELKVGGLADLILLYLDAVKGNWAPADFPPRDLLPAFILRRARRETVRHVMVGGAWVVRNGEHINVETADVERELWERLQIVSREPAQRIDAYRRHFYRAWDRGN